MIEFPKWKYHRTKDAVIVNDKAEELALGPEWEATPAAFTNPGHHEDEVSRPADEISVPNSPANEASESPKKRGRPRKNTEV